MMDVWVLCYTLKFPEYPKEQWPQASSRCFTSRKAAEEECARMKGKYNICKVRVVEE